MQNFEPGSQLLRMLRQAAEGSQARQGYGARSRAATHLTRCGACEPATTPRPAGEFNLYATSVRNHYAASLCRSLVVAKCLGVTGESNSAGGASAGAVPRILPCFRAVVGAVLRRRRCVEHGALDRFQFQWSAAAPWDVTSRTAGCSLTQFCSSQMRESGGWRHSSSSISSFATVATAYPSARGLGAVAFFLGRNSSRFRRHEEVHAILRNTLPSHDDDAFGFQSDVTS